MEDENREVNKEERVLRFIDEINSDKEVSEEEAIKQANRLISAKYGLFLIVMGIILLGVVIFVSTYRVI